MDNTESQYVRSPASRRSLDYLVATLEKAGAKGLTLAEIVIATLWPADTAQHWVRAALEWGDISVAPGEAELAEPHYVAMGTWRDAQADGDAGR